MLEFQIAMGVNSKKLLVLAKLVNALSTPFFRYLLTISPMDSTVYSHAPPDADADGATLPAALTDTTEPFDKWIRVVDLFAGPGGLSEGFTAFAPEPSTDWRPFHIIASVEKDVAACQTLRLRRFYHHVMQSGDREALEAYYNYVRGFRDSPIDSTRPAAQAAWRKAQHEVLERELGEPTTASILRERIQKAQIGPRNPLIVIGGPPCQAYSSVGRARNAGIEGYRPEQDRRHFLYRTYLDLLRDHKPVAFLMENVKGMLTSRVGGQRLFPRILEDLTSPAASGQDRRRRYPYYRIYSLINGRSFHYHQNAEQVPAEQFLIPAECYGVPQARHRVILFGLREDFANIFDRQGGVFPCLCPRTGENGQRQSLTTQQALYDLPPLRSGLSWLRTSCQKGGWDETLAPLFANIAASIEESSLRKAFEAAADQVIASGRLTQGERSVTPSGKPCRVTEVSAELAAWYQGQDPPLVLNHQSRNHMPEDLARYLYCAVYAEKKGISPKAAQFPAALAPCHQNWQTGKFDDRFRVQVADQSAATVMSHMAKDGHYAIHYEPAQCRSLTVREAARLQTFPDSYFFEGNRMHINVRYGL